MHIQTTSPTRLASLCLAALAGCASEVVPATSHAPSNPAVAEAIYVLEQ